MTGKAELRREVLARRRARTPGERERAARQLAAVALAMPEIRRAACVTAYASLATEPGTEPLRSGLRDLGISVLLPVVVENRMILDAEGSAAATPAPQLDWAEDDGELAWSGRSGGGPGSLRLPEPRGPRQGPGAVARAQVLLVPALAVDSDGTRLGRGGGYYDVALTPLTRAGRVDAPVFAVQNQVFALLHDEEFVDLTADGSAALPREPHDVPVDGVITPTRVIRLRSA